MIESVRSFDEEIGRESMRDNRPAILVDLDRTQLDTNEYTRELIMQTVAVLESEIDAENEVKRVLEDRYCYIPVYGSVDTQWAYSAQVHRRNLLAQVQGVPVEDISLDAIDNFGLRIMEKFPDATRFLYPGAEQMLEELKKIGNVSIITFGIQESQEEKLARLPTIADVPHAIIQENKATYINREYREISQVYLIDDRKYDGIPDNCHAIQIDHSGKKEAEPAGIPVVHSLMDAGHLVFAAERQRIRAANP